MVDVPPHLTAQPSQPSQPSAELDTIDRTLLGALQDDGRLSNKELSALVNLAPSSCLARVRRLRSLNVLLGCHAEVAPDAFGIRLQALIAVRLTQHSRAQVDSFVAHADSLPEVMGWFHVTGAHDFLVHVVVRDSHHLRDLALDGFTSRPEVDHLETSIVFERGARHRLPDLG